LNKTDAVNLVLRSIGENPVASLDIQYPTLDIIIPALEEATHEVLTEGWWFNTRYAVTLQPSVSGDTVVPEATIAFYPEDESITFEGTRFVYKDTGDALVNTPVKGKLVTSMAFENCPSTARYAIAYLTAYQVYVSDSGADQSAATLLERYAGYIQQLSAAHTRSQNFNSYRRKTVAKWRANLRA